jgi:hypothetical protein
MTHPFRDLDMLDRNIGTKILSVVTFLIGKSSLVSLVNDNGYIASQCITESRKLPKVSA